jgi:hypothetical protein
MHKEGYWSKRKRLASERGRRMAKARWSKPQPVNPVDADTLRWRALHDRMGRVVYSGVLRGKVALVCHSRTRINSFELLDDHDRVLASGGARQIGEAICLGR